MPPPRRHRSTRMQPRRRAVDNDPFDRPLLPHGWPEILGSILSSTVIFGFLVSLDGMAWASAFGRGVGAGFIVGVVIGGVVGFFFGLWAGLQRTRAGRRSAGFALGASFGGLFFLIAFFGMVFGAFREILESP